MPLYASPEQLMRERSELARKGIARGRSAIAMAYADGVLLVAENPSTTLHKLSEIYDRIGFCAAGRYSEYESLRRAGIKHVDMWGYAYDRRDVSARQLANVYSQTLSSIFTEQIKPFEVDICVAQVGAAFGEDELYRLTYDGFITHEPYYVVMGGQSETITTTLKDSYEHDMTLEGALGVAMHALSSGASGSAKNNGSEQSSGEDLRQKLEVAVLERARPNRAFRRITGAALAALLPETERSEQPEQDGTAGDGDGGSSETS